MLLLQSSERVPESPSATFSNPALGSSDLSEPRLTSTYWCLWRKGGDLCVSLEVKGPTLGNDSVYHLLLPHMSRKSRQSNVYRPDPLFSLWKLQEGVVCLTRDGDSCLRRGRTEWKSGGINKWWHSCCEVSRTLLCRGRDLGVLNSGSDPQLL